MSQTIKKTLTVKFHVKLLLRIQFTYLIDSKAKVEEHIVSNDQFASRCYLPEIKTDLKISFEDFGHEQR